MEATEKSATGQIVSTDPSYTFAVTESRVLTAVFEEIPVYTVTATIDPAGSGTVTGAGQYQDGETCTLVATVAKGYAFVGWQENGVTVSTNESYSFSVTNDRTLVSLFEVYSRLPVGYTELEYIKSDSHSYIQTDLEANFTTRRVVMDIETSNKVSSIAMENIMCADGNNSNYFWFIRYGSSGNIGYRYSNKYGENLTADIGSKRVIADWSFPGKYISIDGKKQTISTSSRAINTKIKLFGDTSIVAKLYSAQIYTNSTLEADYVPCTNQSGIVGVYDLVGGKFYPNAGTGTFTAGPAV